MAMRRDNVAVTQWTGSRADDCPVISRKAPARRETCIMSNRPIRMSPPSCVRVCARTHVHAQMYMHVGTPVCICANKGHMLFVCLFVSLFEAASLPGPELTEQSYWPSSPGICLFSFP